MKLIKNADPDKYGYSDYGIGFGACSQFSLTNVEWETNVFFILGVDKNSSVHAGNIKKF